MNQNETLTIISDCLHYYDYSGKLGSTNHVLVKQLTELMNNYKNVYLCAPLDRRIKVRLSCYNENLCKVHYIPLPKVGGNSILSKMRLIFSIPIWFKRCWKPIKYSDIVYQRFPNNVNLIMVFLTIILGKKRLATYTGTWKNYKGEPITYRFQKFILTFLFKAPFHVYTTTKLTNNKYLIPSFSPSLYIDEFPKSEVLLLKQREKIKRKEIKLVTVGSLSKNKNQKFAIRLVEKMVAKNIDVNLKIIGTGDELNNLKKMVKKLKLNNHVKFANHLSITEILKYLLEVDYLIQPSIQEGFGKSILEAISMGAIPILSNNPFSNFFTNKGEFGFVFNLDDTQSIEKIIAFILRTFNNENWRLNFIKHSECFSKNLTIEKWSNSMIKSLKDEREY